MENNNTPSFAPNLHQEYIEKLSKEMGLPINASTLPIFAVYVIAQDRALVNLLGKMKKRKATMCLVAQEIFGKNSSEAFEAHIEAALLELLHMGCFELGPNEGPVAPNENGLFEHVDRGMQILIEGLLHELPAEGNA